MAEFDFSRGYTITEAQRLEMEALTGCAINPRGAYHSHELPDGRVIDVYPLTFGRAKVTLSRRAEDGGYLDDY